MNTNKPMISYKDYLVQYSGTCTHAVQLKKGGKNFLGVYNGLSYWAKVFSLVNGIDAYGGLVEIDSFSYDYEDPEDPNDPDDEGYQPTADTRLFTSNGYLIG